MRIKLSVKAEVQASRRQVSEALWALQPRPSEAVRPLPEPIGAPKRPFGLVGRVVS